MLFRRKKENVRFVQPIEGEAYFYTVLAYSEDSEFSDTTQKNTELLQQKFSIEALSLVGKLKLIFERKEYLWFEIKERKSTMTNRVWFELRYYPIRKLIAQRNATAKSNEDPNCICKHDLETSEQETLKGIESTFNYLIFNKDSMLE